MKKILITGVAGFIGSNLAERLLREGGYEVIGIDNLSAGKRGQIPKGVKFYELDIRSDRIYPLFGGVDFVFHLAAKNCISDCQKDPVTTAEINVGGSVKVFEAAKRGGVKKVIYAESSALYEGSQVFPTPESEEKPESFYGASKGAVIPFAKSYQRLGLSFTALRYFCVYGPKQDYRRTIPPVMSSFILHLLRKERPVIYGSGEKRRDFVYVDDINDFHLMTLTDPRTDNRVFNLGSGVNYSINELFDKIASLLGSKLTPIRKGDLDGEAKETLASIQAARELGWEPKTAITEGLIQSIQYIKEMVL